MQVYAYYIYTHTYIYIYIYIYASGSTRFDLRCSDVSWFGPVRFGLVPRPVPTGSKIKRLRLICFHLLISYLSRLSVESSRILSRKTAVPSMCCLQDP